jgi:hypothetical protein
MIVAHAVESKNELDQFRLRSARGRPVREGTYLLGVFMPEVLRRTGFSRVGRADSMLEADCSILL